MSKSVKCVRCKDKSWKGCGDKCLDSFFECYICKGYIQKRHYINHMNIQYNDPNLYITCFMCNVNQHISGFRFKNFKCRLCNYPHKYRYKHTRDRFKEYVEKFNIEISF